MQNQANRRLALPGIFLNTRSPQARNVIPTTARSAGMTSDVSSDAAWRSTRTVTLQAKTAATETRTALSIVVDPALGGSFIFNTVGSAMKVE